MNLRTKGAVTAFVLDENSKLLVIRRTDSGRYAIPGGAQEIGETIGATVIREVAEETAICFRARYLGGTPTTSVESGEVAWVSRDDLAGLDIHPSIRLRIEHGFAQRTEPYWA